MRGRAPLHHVDMNKHGNSLIVSLQEIGKESDQRNYSRMAQSRGPIYYVRSLSPLPLEWEGEDYFILWT